MKKLILAALCFVALSLTGAAQAIPLYGTAVFSAGDSHVTLEEIPLAAGEIGSQYASLGLVFGPGMNKGQVTLGENPPNISGQIVASNGFKEPYSVFFASPVDAAGGYWEFNDDSITTIAAYLNGILVESYLYENADCCETTAFLGFQGIIFDEIRVTDMVLGTSLILDNIYFSEADIAAVPEPLTVALLGLGLIGIAAARRRRQPA